MNKNSVDFDRLLSKSQIRLLKSTKVEFISIDLHFNESINESIQIIINRLYFELLKMINLTFFMKMILSWWWTITKSEFESWVVNFNIQCKKSQFTSAINERCRSMRCFIFRWTWSTRFWRFIMSSSNSRFHLATIFELMLSFEIVRKFDSTTSNFMRHKSLSFRAIKLVLSSFFESSFNDKDR
jgi:hypothetical protein